MFYIIIISEVKKGVLNMLDKFLGLFFYSEERELRILFKEHKKWLSGEGGKRLDLSNVDCSNVDFKYQDLRFAIFANADLTNAQFSYCNLECVDFTDCILTNTEFSHANLKNANFSNARSILKEGVM